MSVSSFFFEYGLFAAKFFTVILLIVFAILGIALIFASRSRDREFIEIEKINDKFESMRDVLESEILSKDEQKHMKKERKKKEKEEEKALKKRLKDGENEPLRPKIFFLRFLGDIHASEVDNLREAITAVLMVAKPPHDEVFVTVDSSGGIVHDYGFGASQLRRIRDHGLPLTVSVDFVAASGGYMMACVAEKIIAAPFAVVGSIGVLAQIPNFNRLLEKHNVDIEQHTAGEFKTTLTLLGKNTDKARQKFKEELEETHVLFKDFVHQNRPTLDINKLSTGEHWYGMQALGLNLIDEIKTSDDYLMEKSKHADIYEVSYIITETLSDKISGMLQGASLKMIKGVLSYFQRPQV